MEEVTRVRARQTPRVRIDLNSRSRDGRTRARLRDATTPVRVGQHVIVFEPDDAVAANATVIEVDQQYGFAYLDVDWDSLVDEHLLQDLATDTATTASPPVKVASYVTPAWQEQSSGEALAATSSNSSASRIVQILRGLNAALTANEAGLVTREPAFR